MSDKPIQISTQDLIENLAVQNIVLLDVRPVEAYNGWKLRNELRGGHIQGARSLPSNWTNYLDWIEIVRSKGISPEQPLILYGYDDLETTKVSSMFVRSGYSDVSVYPFFKEEWAADATLPMEKLARYRQLVSAPWLQGLLKTGAAPEYDNDKFVLCHAFYQDKQKYKDGHIPGAIALDTELLESPVTWNRRSPTELKKALESLGISHDTTVILYGRFSNPDVNDPFPGASAGHLGSLRCAFIMMYAGVKDVRVLNGGLQSWLDEGFEVSTEDTSPVAVQDFGAEIPACPEYAVDIPEAKEILKSEKKNLVSVRSWNEYIGEVSGYNYIAKKGRIPGSVFGNCGSDAYHMENYRNLDHTTREYHEIEKMWAEVGITPDKHNSFYCGTGWRGSEAFFNAWLMGWPNASVFDGGWFEWSNDPHNPIETGIP
jgi:thiosulfate/3-mercaptopyruvate sulfurtransferase